MRLDEVLLARFIDRRCESEQIIEQIERHLEGIAEDGRDIEQHIDTRTPEFLERDQSIAEDLALSVALRLGSNQRQHDTEPFAFAFDRIHSPESLRHGSRQ